jgi:hypothetical protein
MAMQLNEKNRAVGLPRFNREFFESNEDLTCIGSGSLGGKAQGLAFVKDIIASQPTLQNIPSVKINIPRMSVLTTSVFDSFLQQNDLYEIAYSDEPDAFIANAFQKASMPADLIGDLRALIANVHSPLAIRSSSLLEDAMFEPFAGIYGTKMIPNNQFDTDTRFRKLVEAIKFVYSSTFFKEAKDYIRATNNKIEDEKMAVIIQEVVGTRHGDRFYPDISGVARSYNFYPIGHAKPEHGVVDLALGLGRTIVDDGISWTYSPKYPRSQPPYGSIKYLLDVTQKEFWAVNMGKPPAYDPIRETEYLIRAGLDAAEEDGTLDTIASTYDAESNRIVMGLTKLGPRIINFAPILSLDMIPLNEAIVSLLKICTESVGAPVEIEFAVTLSEGTRLGFLQVRPMVVSNEVIEITDAEMKSPEKLLSSEFVLGNGANENIRDIVFVKPEKFDAKYTKKIVAELEEINRELAGKKLPYLLIGFGRWGSVDRWLGIPVNWGQISGAKVIVESMLPNMNVELSQGTHFFHNITSFRVLYFSVAAAGTEQIDWEWLDLQPTVREGNFVKHVRADTPLRIKADGRTGRGVILK